MSRELVILGGKWSVTENRFCFLLEILNKEAIQLEGFKLLDIRLSTEILPALIVHNVIRVMFQPAFLSCVLLAVWRQTFPPLLECNECQFEAGMRVLYALQLQ